MKTKISRAGCPHPAATRIVSLILSFAMLLTLTAGLDFSAFADTNADYEYTVLEDGTAKITKYSGSEEDLIIPSKLDGYTVSTVGKNAFFQTENMINVTFPDTVISIDSCFFGCKKLKSIVISKSVEHIEGELFSFCYYVETIVVDEDNPYFDSRNNCNAIIETKTNKLLVGCQNTIIPYGVQIIGERAFEQCIYLKSIKIPNSVTSIEEHAFWNCERLTSIIMSTRLNSIGDYAFFACKALAEIPLPKSLKYVGESAFYKCADLSTVYYEGSQDAFNEIKFENGNQPVLDATINYNCEICDHDVFWKIEDNSLSKKCDSCNKIILKLPFIDLAIADYVYYGNFVEYTSVTNSFLKGTNPPANNVFEPARAIDRAMMVTILYRMAGEPYANGGNPYTSSPFTDITNTSVYYYDAACWALKNGVTTETTFKPFNNVTREQTATFLYRYAQDNDKLGDTDYKNVNLNAYHDGNSISHFAVEAMQWANYNGMITGTQQGYINPQGATQRIHATKILYGFGKTCNIGNFG